MLIDGFFGTIGLVITTALGSGLHEIGLSGFGLMIVSAIFAYFATAVGNYALSIGIASITMAIFKCSAALLVLLSAIFLSQ